MNGNREAHGRNSVSAVLSATLWRSLWFATLWWVLAGGAAWGFGAPVIAAAVGASLALQPARRVRLRPWGLLRFAGYFLTQSPRAGLDVARRAFAPGLPLAPALLTFRLRLPEGPARTLLVNTMSLLPGSLSAGIEGNRLRLHVLDTRLPVEQELREVEARIAAMFGVELKPDNSTQRRREARSINLKSLR
ncbi:MAG: Na+/H+ antiporter subunit E [Sulfuricaulis sp.]